MAYMRDKTGRRLDSFQVREFRPVRETANLGDSIDADPTGWWPSACALSGQRMRQLYNGGVGGDTTTMALARIGNVLNQTPDVCIIGGGISNDIAQGFPTATTRANLTSMVTQLRAVGITPVFRNCPPRGAGVAPYNTDALAIAAVLAHNAWVDSYAAAEGLEVIDLYTPLVDPATGMMLAENADDGMHPNKIGSLKAARAFCDNMPTIFADAAPFDLTTKNIGTRVKNPLFIANTGGQATDWANGSGFTTRDVATKAPAGNWQHYTKTDSGAWALTTQQVPIPPGSAITIGFRAAVALGAMLVSYRFKDAANVAVGATNYTTIRTPFTRDDNAVFIIRAVSPATAVSMEMTVQNQTDGLGPLVDFSIAQFTMTVSDK